MSVHRGNEAATNPPKPTKSSSSVSINSYFRPTTKILGAPTNHIIQFATPKNRLWLSCILVLCGTFPVCPAFSMAVMSSSHPSRLFLMLGAKPPSSPTLHASVPYLALMTDLRAWYT